MKLGMIQFVRVLTWLLCALYSQLIVPLRGWP